MVNYNPNGNKKNIVLIIITALFLIIGTAFIVIGCWNDMLSWFKTFGIALLVLVSPLIIWFIYKFILKKIKDM